MDEEATAVAHVCGTPAIADVSNTPLAVLLSSDDSVLGVSIRLLLETDTKGESYAGHNTSI
jgi:hypothetical protein